MPPFPGAEEYRQMFAVHSTRNGVPVQPPELGGPQPEAEPVGEPEPEVEPEAEAPAAEPEPDPEPAPAAKSPRRR